MERIIRALNDTPLRYRQNERIYQFQLSDGEPPVIDIEERANGT